MKKLLVFVIVIGLSILGFNSFNAGKVSNNISKKVVKKEIINDKGIFKKYYSKVNKKINKMTIDEKISQILLVRYPDNNQLEILKKNQFGGYIFFARDFKDKTKKEVRKMMDSLQKNSKIPLLIAVDEEGGIVVRVSSNPNIRSERFKSSRELYELGGLSKIKEDTIEKNGLLKELGINLNLAPVVDIATDPNDYMYSRALGQDKKVTGDFAKEVINTSKKSGVSYCLKHFPGYGNNSDTHNGISIDTRKYEDIINNDLYPFKKGIKAGCESILVSHNIVNSIDGKNPASLSEKVNKLLRKNLKFTGVIITDDLDMGAVLNIENKTVKAIKAGNDLIITTDYTESINSIKRALQNRIITEKQIDKAAFRVLAWKYYKGLMSRNK